MAIVKFTNYVNEVLVQDYNYLPYTIAGYMSFYTAVLFLIVTACVINKARKLKPSDSMRSFLSYCIAMLISGNIIYIFCYLLPFMFVAFLHDPLLTFSTYLTVVTAIFCFSFLTVSVMSVWWANTNHMFMFVSCSFVIIMLTCIFAFVLMTIIFVMVLLFESFSDFQLLQAVLLSLLLSLHSLWILKPIYKKVLRHSRIHYTRLKRYHMPNLYTYKVARYSHWS